MSAARPSASFDHGTLLDGHLQQLLYCRPDGTCLVPRCRSGSPDSHHGHQSFAEGHGSPHDDWYLCRHDIYSHVYPLVVGQAIGRDFYAKTINKEATPEKEVFVTRVAVTVVALACMLFNYTNPPHFLSIFLYLGLSGIGSCIGVPLFTGIVSDRGTKEGAIASSIMGPTAYMVFTYAMGVNFWVSCLLAVLVAALMMIGVSALVHRKAAMTGEMIS